MSSLLSLPLVLVQDILQFVVCSPDCSDEDELGDLLELREVNSLFEREITKYFARMSLCELELEQVIRMLPYFKVRLLQEHLGEEYRRGGPSFARHIHAVADFLDQHLIPPEHPGDRQKILSDICETFIQARKDWNTLEDEFDDRHEQKWITRDVHATSFIIAIHRNYAKLRFQMLQNGSASPFSNCEELGQALETAIRCGNLDAVTSLDPDGEQIVQESGYDHWEGPIHRALKIAAAKGHLETIRWVLPQLHIIGPPYESICYSLFEAAAISNQPVMAKHLLDGYRMPWDEVNVRTPLSWFCRHGQEELVRQLVELDLIPGLDSANAPGRRGRKKIPLQHAAAAGHIGICRFLLDDGKAGGDLQRLASNMFLAAVTGGNVEVLKLFEERGLGKLPQDARFSALLIAAANGHIEMARYVVEKKYDASMLRKRGGWLDTTTIRYYALVHAVMGDQPEMIRWLVEELGIHPDGEEDSWERGYSALNIAIALGNVGTVKLLVGLGATPTEFSVTMAECVSTDSDEETTVFEIIEMLREEMNMVGERQPTPKLVFASTRKLNAALAAVDPDMYGVIRLFGSIDNW